MVRRQKTGARVARSTAALEQVSSLGLASLSNFGKVSPGQHRGLGPWNGLCVGEFAYLRRAPAQALAGQPSQRNWAAQPKKGLKVARHNVSQ